MYFFWCGGGGGGFKVHLIDCKIIAFKEYIEDFILAYQTRSTCLYAPSNETFALWKV